jgi:two-component system, OmpR family, sensor kinase
MSLRARLLLVLAGLAVAGLLVADIVTYAALRSFLVDRVDRTLAASARTLQQPLGRRGFADQGDLAGLAELAPGVRIQTRDPNGDVVGSTVLSGAAGGGEPLLPARLPAGESNFTVGSRGGGAGFRVLSVPVGFRGTLVLAAPLDDVAATSRRLVLVELIVSLLVVAAIVGVGWWLVRVGLLPLTRIGDTAAAIGAGDLSRRVETGAGPRTEVGRLASSLNAMLGQLEAAFAARTASERRLRRFVGDASHELRTPLTAVQAYAELFERGARERPEDLARAMAGIERESKRMGELVDELLLLARLDQGRPLERADVDLAAVVRDAVDAARAVEPSRSWSLDVPDRLEVVGDETRLRQVLDNLLGNVRSHTPATAPARVRLSRRAGSAVIEVADAGPGLSAEAAARAFERFYRADPSRSRDHGGSGLGLAIVAAIAEAHGGRASVESRPGEGARFSVSLPAGHGAWLELPPGSGATPSDIPPGPERRAGEGVESRA